MLFGCLLHLGTGKGTKTGCQSIVAEGWCLEWKVGNTPTLVPPLFARNGPLQASALGSKGWNLVVIHFAPPVDSES